MSYGAIRKAGILKVFSHCPNLKMWQFSKESRTTNSTHSCLDYGSRCVYTDTPYLFECGVLHRLFDSGLPQPSVRQTKQPHTFFLYKSVIWGGDITNNCLWQILKMTSETLFQKSRRAVFLMPIPSSATF